MKNRGAWVIGLLLLVLTFVSFIPLFECGYVHFDDDAYLLDNAAVTRPISLWSIQTLMTHSVLELWHPMTTLTLHVGYQFWGLNPAGYHGLSLAMHMGSVALLFWLLTEMTGSKWRAAAVTMVFAIHPLRVESLAWVVEVKDVGSVFFALLCMVAYVLNIKRPSWKYQVVAAVSLALSLMYKPMFVTMPAILLLMDFWPLARMPISPDGPVETAKLPRQSWKALALEKLPVVILVAMSVGITLWRTTVVGVRDTGEMAKPLWLRLSNIPISYVRYMASMVDFQELSVHYRLPPAWPVWQVAGATALLIAISLLTVWYRRRFPMVFMGWWWFVLSLVPVIGLVEVSDYSMADRYTYFSAIGLCIAVVYAIPASWGEAKAGKVVMSGIAGVVIVVLGASTWHQLSYWKSEETLCARGMEIDPLDSFHYVAYGLARARAGDLEESDKYLKESVRLDQYQATARIVLMLRMRNKGQYQEALDEGHALLKLVPRNVDVYREMAETYVAMGDLDKAIEMLDKTVQMQPGSPIRLVNRGLVLLRKGRAQDAALDFQSALAVEPDNFQAHSQLGFMYAQVGAVDDAVYHFEQALERTPDIQVGIALGQQLAKAGKWREAAEAFKNVRALDPKNATVMINEAVARTRSGDSKSAIALLREAAALSPDSSVVYDMLAMLLYETGDKEKALEALRKAEVISPGNAERSKRIAELEGK